MKKASEVLINKGLVRKAEEMFKGKYEIAIISLAPARRMTFELETIVKNMDEALAIKKSLENEGKAVRLLLKSKGNKYKATYLSDFKHTICLSQGLNRALEANIVQLRNKLNPRKNQRTDYSLEMTGYMGFGFNQAQSVYVCTRLYETKAEAHHYITKRYGVDKDSVEILEVSRLADGSFRFSKTAYEQMKRIKNVKLSKLVEKFGEEAYIIMEEIEKQRAEINEQLKLAKELAQATDKEFMVDEKSQLAHAYITNALEAIKNAQKEITHSNLETLTSEIGKVAVDPCITNAKEHNATAIKETVRAQRLLENILTGDDKNNKAVKES